MPDAIQQLAGFDPLAAGGGEHPLHHYLVVDVFTESPLEGNPVAVFADARGLTEDQMQRAARELNLSETVFVLPPRAQGDVRIRIFTPAHELSFAGHPVLGTAIALGSALARTDVTIETGLGLIPLQLHREGARVVFGWMRQAIPSWSTYEHRGELLRALGVQRSRLPVEAYSNGPLHVYVELDSEAAVGALRPDLRALAELGVAANCFAGSGRHWKTRMFAPSGGVPEDPATGSAAGPLAVHLSRHGRISFGDEIEIRQGAEVARPSLLYARAQGTAERLERVEVGGAAVIVARGDFRLS
jgi:trans-2,3-dihydro-3-hydroxyanthranilate isomerase